MARVNRKVSECVSFSLCDVRLTRWHVGAEQKRMRTLAYKWTPKVIPLILLNVVWAHASRKGWAGTGGKGLSGVWEREGDPGERVSRSCEACICCCVLCQKTKETPPPPPFECIIRLFLIRHSQWRDNTMQARTSHSSGRSSSRSNLWTTLSLLTNLTLIPRASWACQHPEIGG